MPSPILQLNDVQTHFPVESGFLFRHQTGTVKAVDGITLNVQRGEVLGLVGESGCGKSTLARTIMQLVPTTAGTVLLEGRNLTAASAAELLVARRDLQMIFQDPFASLNPRKRAGDAILEALELMDVGEPAARSELARHLFMQTGLRPEQLQLFPHQFSGGQRQRIVLARALAARPELVVCDEPVSALDVAIQAQILNLMQRLQRELGLTYLFISHDLGVIRHMCDEIGVMYLGQIVEQADRQSLFERPLHPYTLALWSAAPSFDPGTRSRRDRIRLQGDPPSPINVPPGCRFAGRCPFAEARCHTEPPALRTVLPGHQVACHRVSDGGAPLYPVFVRPV